MRSANQENQHCEKQYCCYCGAKLNSRPSIVCPQCHTHNDTDSKYCKNCATLLPTFIMCIQCNTRNDSDSLFCKTCGTRLRTAGHSDTALESVESEEHIDTSRLLSLPEYHNSQVGEYFEFGSYSYLANGAEAPIEWRVLRRGYNRMLAVSRYGLDSRSYHDELEGVTWEKCSLRKWLNNRFLSKAFNELEQDCILTVMLSNEDNHEYSTPGGNATSDRVFLLSLKEVDGLFRDSRDRCCRPTPYAANNGAWQFETEEEEERSLKGCGWWWLRSPGGTAYTPGGPSCTACDIDYDGNIDTFGLSVGLGYGIVRPAIMLKI
ncbi:hypothetical protein IJT17_10015 [bacterium]|nr:hypothetical protein [bacterium]